MDFIILLQSNTLVALSTFCILGLLVGSFLNVVIHRTPLRMFYEWRKETTEFLISEKDIGEKLMSEVKEIISLDQPISLSHPASRCPNCGHKIRWYENIPIISWIFLLGKCSDCKTPISIRYPFVELLTAILSVLVIQKFGVTAAGISSLLLVWMLVALSGIDFDTKLLPDRFTFPLAGLGLLVNSFSVFTSPSSSILGLVIGYLALWTVTKAFAIIKKIDGMGIGDFKLLAVLGAWLGIAQIPTIILLSSTLGLFVGTYLFFKNNFKSLPFPFGPCISIAGVISLLYNDEIAQWQIALMAI